MRCSFRLIVSLAAATLLHADDGARLLRLDHFVRVKSVMPAMKGESSQIYVREVVRAGTVLRGGPNTDRVALFIHGAGTPAEVAFDVPHEGYSWMQYLAEQGFDVFSMDMTGYGRSTRPEPMNDPCNLSSVQQTQFVKSPCAGAVQRNQVGTLESDWHDIEAVVDYVRALRYVEKLNLLGWSLGGPRSLGYAAAHPGKVRAIVLLAPAYSRAAGRGGPTDAAAFNTQSREELDANWDRQVTCPKQFDLAVRESVWTAMLESDSVGATWGTGVRRAPNTAMTPWTQAVPKMTIPTLFVAGASDAQVPPDRVKELYEDFGAPKKVFADLACSSHNALWEANHTLLFRASAEWLTKGSVNGTDHGVVRLGY